MVSDPSGGSSERKRRARGRTRLKDNPSGGAIPAAPAAIVGLKGVYNPPALAIAGRITSSTFARRTVSNYTQMQPGIPSGAGAQMNFESICVVGAGRVGKAVAARLADRVATRSTGRELQCSEADLVLLCVPDGAIADTAASITPGPWVAHTSGATTLDALAPHERRFSIHPLQTFIEERGPEQLDGTWAAVSGETEEALAAGFELARLLRLRPFELDDEERPMYHAGAVVAASFLVTLHEAASELFRAAGAPPQALEPLMRRVIENGFQPTGPHVRGDWGTIERHLAELRDRHHDLEPLYRALSEATASLTR